jgi:hypothetical protein
MSRCERCDGKTSNRLCKVCNLEVKIDDLNTQLLTAKGRIKELTASSPACRNTCDVYKKWLKAGETITELETKLEVAIKAAWKENNND